LSEFKKKVNPPFYIPSHFKAYFFYSVISILFIAILLMILGNSSLIAIPLGMTVEVQYDLTYVGLFLSILGFGGIVIWYFIDQKHEEEN